MKTILRNLLRGSDNLVVNKVNSYNIYLAHRAIAVFYQPSLNAEFVKSMSSIAGHLHYSSHWFATYGANFLFIKQGLTINIDDFEMIFDNTS